MCVIQPWSSNFFKTKKFSLFFYYGLFAACALIFYCYTLTMLINIGNSHCYTSIIHPAWYNELMKKLAAITLASLGAVGIASVAIVGPTAAHAQLWHNSCPLVVGPYGLVSSCGPIVNGFHSFFGGVHHLIGEFHGFQGFR